MVDISDIIGILGDDKPTAQVDTSIRELALAAAEARDEATEANAKARLLKDELAKKLREAKLEGIELPDRTIRFKTTNNKQKTLKAIKVVLGEDEGKKLWDNLPTTPSTSLDIPAPKPPQVEEPDE